MARPSLNQIFLNLNLMSETQKVKFASKEMGGEREREREREWKKERKKDENVTLEKHLLKNWTAFKLVDKFVFHNWSHYGHSLLHKTKW